MGRPIECTPAVAKRICDCLRLGGTRAAAATAAGVSQAALYEWMARARRGDGFFAEFAEQLKMAEAEAEAALLGAIAAASHDPKHWTAAAWILERRFPKRWGRRDRVSMDAKVQQMSGDNMTDAKKLEVARAYVAELEQRMGPQH